MSRHAALPPLVATLALLGAAAHAAPPQPATPDQTAPAPALEPGREVPVQAPGVLGTFRVFLPADYDPARPTPVLLFYMWMGGQPSTEPLRAYTGGRTFIVAALPYASEEPAAATTTGNRVELERRNLRAVRTWLGRHANVDESRVFLSGASKGGWNTALLGEREIDRLAGLVILLAGRQPGPAGTPPPAGLRGKPIYVGAGELDANLLPALDAAAFYRRHGARVTFEEYAGQGHAPPQDPAAFKAWLDVAARFGAAAPAAGLAADWDPPLMQNLAAAQATSNALARYTLLRALVDDPRLPFASPATTLAIRQAGRDASLQPPGREEWTAETAFRQTCALQQAAQTPAQWRAAADAWQQTADASPATHYGRLAARAAEQARTVCARLDEALRNQRTRTPAPTRVAPPRMDIGGAPGGGATRFTPGARRTP